MTNGNNVIEPGHVMMRRTSKPTPMLKQRRLQLSITVIFLLLSVLILALPGNQAAPTTSFAVFKKTLRVMTYNIHVGVGMDKKLDLQRIADVINKQKPDLVGLQEVDRGVKRTEGKDEIAELAALTKMDYAFAHNLDYQGGQYGVAILSRSLLKNVEHRMFANLREAERRGMLKVEVEVEGKTVNFVTTHLDYQYEDGRVYETEQMLKFLERIQGPTIVVADLNDEPTGAAYKMISAKFADAWVVSRAKGDGFSYPADKPIKRIDHIFFNGENFKAKRAYILETLASDHVPVVAELQLK